MSSNSSTSNSKDSAKANVEPTLSHAHALPDVPIGSDHPRHHILNPLEKMSASRIPWGAIGLVVCVVVIELLLHFNRVWFADRAAWQWEVKHQMLDEGRLQGDIAIMGTSVLFHGIDASLVNQITHGHPRVENLALNGMQIHQIAQSLEDQLEEGHVYGRVLLELRDVALDRENWIGGPYWRFWATWDDLASSGILIHEPSLVMSFTANHLLTSYEYRAGLNNWISASARQHRLVREYHDRNQQVAAFMRTHEGFSDGGFEHTLAASAVPPLSPEPLETNALGLYWMNRMMTFCESHQVKLTLLVPPAPPFVLRDRAAAGYDQALEAAVKNWRQTHPRLELDVLRIQQGYERADFADRVHLSPSGVHKLTRDLAQWALSLQTTRQAASRPAGF